MTPRRFVQEHLPRWQELEALLESAGPRGLRAMTGDEARRLGTLYRALTSDLATARTIGVDRDTIAYLNRLAYVAHDLVYAGRRRDSGRSIWTFLRVGFGDLVVRTWRYHVASFGIFLVAALITFAVVRGQPELAETTSLVGMVDRARETLAVAPENREYVEIPEVLAPLFSWGLMANNIQVTLIAFGLGAFGFGLGSIGILALNGSHVGGALAVYHNEGIPELLWTWMAAHGPVELTAIFIAAGAGIRLGLSLALPDRRGRLRAFQEKGRDSVGILGGTSVMLVIAGLLEGFVSPSSLPPVGKFVVGAATIVAMAWYFGGAARRVAREGSSP